MDVKNEAFLPLFAEVKELLAPYAARLTVRKDEPGYFDLWSEKDIEVDGRRRKDVFFCGLIIQKSYVGFYFMPLYADQERVARCSDRTCWRGSRASRASTSRS